MYIIKDILYADAGKYLKCGNRIAFQMKASDGIEELDLNLDDMVLENNYIYYNNRMFSQETNKFWGYGDYKSRIVKKRYSVDDQIAVMLNKENSSDDQLRYQKMQEWRDFASVLAGKIMNFVENNV